MLILTRRVGETLVIDNEILVTVLGIKGNQVRLGTTAPSNVEVHREEIWNRIQHAKKAKESEMGEIADSILNGDFCQFCGEHLESGNGFPQSCASCMEEDTD